MRIVQFVVFLLVPLANYLPFVLLDNARPFDDDAFVYSQPAGYAFGIWGPIFLGMILYAWFQMQSGRVESPHLRRATLAAISAGLASIAFVPISYTDLKWLGFIDIIWHLVSLIVLFISLRRQFELESHPNTRWFYLPTQMYLGWICAATAVSASLFLVEAGLELPDSTQILLTVVVIAALATVAIYMISKNGGVVGLVVIWALIALIVENGSVSLIKYASIAAIVFIVAYLILHLRGRGRLSYG